eukprot:597215-Prymnesium_polylepis.2
MRLFSTTCTRTRAPGTARSKICPHSLTRKRRRVAGADACAAMLPVLALSLSLPAAPRAAAAFDLDTTLYLTTLLQLRADVAATDAQLFAGLLEPPAKSAVTTEEGRVAFLRVRKMLKEYKPVDLGRDAVAAAVRAKALGRRDAAAAEAHAREVRERLAAVVEADAYFDGLNRDALNRAIALMPPEQLRFIHSSLRAAQVEIDEALRCFGEAERGEAVRLWERAFAKAGDAGPSASLGATAVAEPSDAVLRAIDAMPSTVGTALTRGDLQTSLNDAYRENRSR